MSNTTISKIDKGMTVLVGIANDDTKEDAEYIARKILNLRLWPSADGSKQWNTNVISNKFEVLLVSQFTLYAKLKGNKLDFHHAMGPETSKVHFARRIRSNAYMLACKHENFICL